MKNHILFLMLTTLMAAVGCQENKTPAEVYRIKERQQAQIRNAIVATCDNCNTYVDLAYSPRDIAIARDPSLEQDLYLTVVDDEGVAVTCCKEKMRLRVDPQGKLYLYCKSCGKLKPVAVEDGKVVAVEADTH